MIAADFFRLAGQALLQNRRRSALSLLGVVIGVVAVTCLTAIGTTVRTAEMRRPRCCASARVRSFGMPPTPIGMPPVVSLRPGAITTIELPRLANWSVT